MIQDNLNQDEQLKYIKKKLYEYQQFIIQSNSRKTVQCIKDMIIILKSMIISVITYGVTVSIYSEKE